MDTEKLVEVMRQADALRAGRYPHLKNPGKWPTVTSWEDLKPGWIWASDMGNAVVLVSIEPSGDLDRPAGEGWLYCQWKCCCGRGSSQCGLNHLNAFQKFDRLRPGGTMPGVGHMYFLWWDKATDKAQYPHTCPRCTEPAYVGGGPANLDCSNARCVSKNFGKVAVVRG